MNVDLKKLKRNLFRYLLCDNKRPKVRGNRSSLRRKVPWEPGPLHMGGEDVEGVSTVS